MFTMAMHCHSCTTQVRSGWQSAPYRLPCRVWYTPFTPHNSHGSKHTVVLRAALRCTNQYSSTSATSLGVSKREIVLAGLAAAGALATPLRAAAKPDSGDWSSPGLAAPEDPSAPKFFKTANGVRVQELSRGSSEIEVQPGDAVLVDYVLRRSNGYFIYGTVEGVSFQPKDVPVGPVLLKLGSGSVVPGLEEALLGMHIGGKRRVLVPPELGYTSGGGAELQPQPPTFATKRQLANHAREPLLYELELLRIRRS